MKIEEYLSTSDIARAAGVHRTTAYGWVVSRKFKWKHKGEEVSWIEVGKNLMVHNAAVKKFLAARKKSS